MSGWDELLARLTERLSVDPELRLDVAEELRGHLEDSAAEFRRAGESDEQAAASATKALGNEAELAEMLWQANRMRMRIRGVLRWSARVALIPAAIGVIIVLLYGLSGGHAVAIQELQRGRLSFADVPNSWTEHLSADQRLILLGDPQASTDLEKAKSITDRWPDNPIYYGDYAVLLLTKGGFFEESEPKLERLDELLAAMDRGEQIDPDNAFYDFVKAAYLINLASEVSEDTEHSYRQKNRRGKVRDVPYHAVEIHDQDLFRRGLAELRSGLGKGEVNSHSLDMVHVRQRLLPQPTRYNDHVRRLTIKVSVLVHPLSEHRRAAKALCGHAVDLAKAGQADQAIAVIESVELMAVKIGGQSRMLIELLVAEAIRTVALAHKVRVYAELGRADDAAQAHTALAEAGDFYYDLRNRPGVGKDQLAQSGLMGSILIPSLPGYEIDLEPSRTAEQYVISESVLLVLLVLLVVVILLLGAATAAGLLFRTKEDRPLLLFVGWRRIGKICLLAVVAPLAAYALYAYVLTAADRVYGWGYTFNKTLLEFSLVVAAVYVLLTRLSYSAVRRRAGELGLDAPPPIRLRDRRYVAAIGALLALASAVYLIGWRMGHFRPALSKGDITFGPGAILASAIGAYLVAFKVREYFGTLYQKTYKPFRRALRRSLLPILASAVILIGASCGWALALRETAAVRRMTGRGDLSFRTEIDRSAFSQLRQRMAERHEQMLAKSER